MRSILWPINRPAQGPAKVRREIGQSVGGRFFGEVGKGLWGYKQGWGWLFLRRGGRF